MSDFPSPHAINQEGILLGDQTLRSQGIVRVHLTLVGPTQEVVGEGSGGGETLQNGVHEARVPDVLQPTRTPLDRAIGGVRTEALFFEFLLRQGLHGSVDRWSWGGRFGWFGWGL